MPAIRSNLLVRALMIMLRAMVSSNNVLISSCLYAFFGQLISRHSLLVIGLCGTIHVYNIISSIANSQRNGEFSTKSLAHAQKFSRSRNASLLFSAYSRKYTKIHTLRKSTQLNYFYKKIHTLARTQTASSIYQQATSSTKRRCCHRQCK